MQERLQRLIIVDAPAVFWILWNAVSPFVDPVTRAKVHFATSKKHNQETGALLSGAPDPSGLDKLWSIYKQPYVTESYFRLLTSAKTLKAETEAVSAAG
jgi:hypothetical protein